MYGVQIHIQTFNFMQIIFQSSKQPTTVYIGVNDIGIHIIHGSNKVNINKTVIIIPFIHPNKCPSFISTSLPFYRADSSKLSRLLASFISNLFHFIELILLNYPGFWLVL